MATQRKTSTAKAAEAAVETGKETVDTFVKAGTEAATKNAEKAFRMGQEQFEKANAKTFETLDELYSFNKSNVDAVVAAGSIYLKGVEALNKEIVAYAQKSVETGLANAKAVMAAKSFNEFVALQNDLARKAFDEAVVETTRISELTTKVTNEAVKPISDRVKVTVEHFGKAA